MPVPLRLTVCGLPESLLAMVKVPVRVPIVMGEKLMLKLQLAPDNMVPQLFWPTTKSLLLDVTDDITKLLDPLFVTVKFDPPITDVPIPAEENNKFVGDTETDVAGLTVMF